MKETIIILRPECGGTLAERLADLRRQVKAYASRHSDWQLLWTRVYLSDMSCQWAEVKAHALYRDWLSRGAVSAVEQAPLSGCKVALLMGWTAERVMVEGAPECCIVGCADGVRYIYHSVRLDADEAADCDGRRQTRRCFKKHSDLLKGMGLSLRDNCHRTWLYVRDIDMHYASVVRGRNEVFEREGLTADTHFIASTGIEGKACKGNAVVGIDFWSVDDGGRAKVEYLQAPDYLNPTYQYGVAFERATSVSLCGQRILVSGTASIDNKGRCLHVGDIELQTERMLVNIDHLLKAAGSRLKEMPYLIVYLRDLSDYATVRGLFDKQFPGLPVLITQAPVCRPDWLIEAETMVVKPQ